MTEVPPIFRPPRDEDFLDAAVAAARFIDSRKITGEHGVYWSLDDARSTKPDYYDDLSFYSGSAGIAHFLLELAAATGQDAYLDDAVAAAHYMQWRWENRRPLVRNFSPWAFTTGYSGVAHTLLEVFRVTGEEGLVRTIHEIVEAAIDDAQQVGEGYGWSTYHDIVGDAGTILTILEMAEAFEVARWRDFAVQATRAYFGRSRRDRLGNLVYNGVDPAYFGAQDDYIDPNFPMGAAGISFLLLRVYEVSGDQRFRDAALGVPAFLQDIAITTPDGAAALTPHGIPDRGDLYYLGYCHGPVGTARLFHQLHTMTGEPVYRDWEYRFAAGIRAAGAPERHSDGYWNTHNLCCGTAGFVTLYLGIWAAYGDRDYLGEAENAGRHLLHWQRDERWYIALDRVTPEKISSPIGMYDGAAGIGWVLLQLYLAKTDQFSVQRTIDDPYPSTALTRSARTDQPE